MSHIPYTNTLGTLMFGMECLNISYAIGVVNKHMGKIGKEYWNGCFGILEA